jgi:hypothetical protein
MNFMRGLADGMDFYRDERSREKAMRFLSKEPRPKGGALKTPKTIPTGRPDVLRADGTEYIS